MRHRLAAAIALLAFGLALSLAPPVLGAGARRAPARASRAESLYVRAVARLADGSIEYRRMAIAELEEATLLAPDDLRFLDAFGRACLDGEFENRARGAFERSLTLEPRDAAAQYGLGLVWKRDWLRYLADSSLARSARYFGAAARLDPADAEAWLQLAPLLYERGAVREAVTAVGRAREADPDRAEVQLAAGWLDWRAGRTERAESLFTAALPRLPAPLAARFGDLVPLLTPESADEYRALVPAERAEYERRFWSACDPDPTTSLNEARLEYWARVAYASLLLRDPGHERWDLRAELYERFGAPQGAAYQPPGVPLALQQPGPQMARRTRLNGIRSVADPMWFPMHAMVVDYHDLGMTVLLLDPALSGHYQLPPTYYGSPEPVPSPAARARRDLVMLPGARGMFPVLPAGVRPLELAARLSRFEGERGPRLLAQLEVPGGPLDSLWAECVLIDSTEREVVRAGRDLGPSACEPTALRTADFAFDVPPGRYRVGFSVRDGEGGRGVLRARESLAPAPRALALSDLVVVCGRPEVARDLPEVRLNPNLGARVTGGDPLVAYFEVYHLQPGEGDRARFEYEYTVEPEGRDPRPWLQRVLSFGGRPASLAVRSMEMTGGPLRRQFITVPTQSLPAGSYRLVVKVRDLNAGTSATATARFLRV